MKRFTLVEIMIVIAILGLLLAIIIPAICNKNKSNGHHWSEQPQQFNGGR